MKRILTILLLSTFLTATIGCRYKPQPTVKGSGTIAQETRSVSGFSKLNIWGIGDIQIIQGQEESLQITCDDNFMDIIESRVAGDTLYLGPDQVKLKPSQTIKYRLSLKSLDALQCSGALSIQSESLTCTHLQLTANGVCSLSLDTLQADSIVTMANGASKVRMGPGTARSQTITLNGAGQYQSPDLRSEETILTINGTGQATVWAETALSASLHGAGSISYYGSPQVTQSVAGVGRIKSLGEKDRNQDSEVRTQ